MDKHIATTYRWLKQKKIFTGRPKTSLLLDRAFWTLEVWPIHLLLLIIFFHIFFISFLNYTQRSTFNNGFGSLLQIIGTSVVLFCIVNNLELLKGKNFIYVIKEEFSCWCKRWPTGHPKVIKLSSKCESRIYTSEVNVKDLPNFNNIEDKVEYLLKRTDELEKTIHEIKNSLTNTIEEVNKEAKLATQTLQKDIKSLKTNMDHAVISSIKPEIAGFLIAAYGVVISGFF